MEENIYNNNNFTYKKTKTKNMDRVPIRRGCPNQQCFCIGNCRDIVGWRDKFPNEN